VGRHENSIHFLFVSGAPVLGIINFDYGILSQTTSLSCTEASITPSTTYTFFKAGTQIFTTSGEVNPVGKYTTSRQSGRIVLNITNTQITDEDTYGCAVGFATVVNYDLVVEGKLNFFIYTDPTA